MLDFREGGGGESMPLFASPKIQIADFSNIVVKRRKIYKKNKTKKEVTDKKRQILCINRGQSKHDCVICINTWWHIFHNGRNLVISFCEMNHKHFYFFFKDSIT